jgi:hypothetical protein
VNKLLTNALILLAAFLVSACGGGGDDEPISAPGAAQEEAQAATEFRDVAQASEPALSAAANFNGPSFTLGGVAFAGGPLLQTTVSVRDAVGRSWAASPSVSTSGHWAIALPVDAKLPLLVRATGYLAGQPVVLFSRYSGPSPTVASLQYLNITPYTDALTRRMYSSRTVEVLMNLLAVPLPAVDNARAANDEQILRRLLENYLSRLALPRDFNFFTHFSQATGWGYSGLLERVGAGFDASTRRMVLRPLIGPAYVVPDQAVSLPLNAAELNAPELNGSIFVRLKQAASVLQQLPQVPASTRTAYARGALHEVFLDNGNAIDQYVSSEAQFADATLSHVSLHLLSCDAANTTVRSTNFAGVQAVGRVCQARLGWAVGPSGSRSWASSETQVLITMAGQTSQLRVLGNSAACPVQKVHQIDIQTLGAAPVVSKVDYLTATIKVTSAEGAVSTIATQIRGRGNSTWSMPKKPFRLRTNTAVAMLGMPSSRNWAMLANYSDKSLLRTAVAFCIAKNMGMKWVPENRFAEVTLNGEYQGLYQVTPHIEDGASKADIGSGPGVKFLVEIDARLDGDYPYVTSRGVPTIIKSKATSEEAAAVQAFLETMEARLQSNALPWEIIDRDEFIKYYLVQEFTRNNDAFWSSTFLYKKPDGKVVFGPVWDFDIALGNVDYNNNWLREGYWIRYATYVAWAFQDPAFASAVRSEWALVAQRHSSIQRFIDLQARSFEHAQTRNFVKWPILSIYVWPNATVTGSYAGEVAYLKAWLRARYQWMDANQWR